MFEEHICDGVCEKESPIIDPEALIELVELLDMWGEKNLCSDESTDKTAKGNRAQAELAEPGGSPHPPGEAAREESDGTDSVACRDASACKRRGKGKKGGKK
jgi:hypothetical protein